jgi:hypothetical protein
MSLEKLRELLANWAASADPALPLLKVPNIGGARHRGYSHPQMRVEVWPQDILRLVEENSAPVQNRKT